MKHTLLSSLLALSILATGASAKLPNILWVTSEDNGPHLGCYGDSYATTPNLDALAARSLIYLNCWSTAPVCAPARTTLISGMYPTSTGSQHMRSTARLPDAFKFYPVYLREAGYYCINPGKTDYNLETDGQVWDNKKVSLKKLAKRYTDEGKPFMAVYNHTISHESKLRTRPHKQVHDPALAPLPKYHPDAPEVRQDWAQYYDRLTEMDAQVGEKLKELEESGVADDTIIFYYGDHGSGMPRSKRWPYNSGLHVPLIVHVPEKHKDLAPKDYKAGGKTDRLVGFVDFAATLLSIAGVKPPEHFHGHAFLGKHIAPEPKHLWGFRGRMDERYDMVRTVRNKRYQYIRNYNPHEIYGQHVSYMFQTPTTRKWKELFDAGKLNEAQSHFWKTKPAEELYDLETDPDEVNNLVGSAEHAAVLAELREAQRSLALETRDLGFLPEGEIHSRAAAAGLTPWEMGQKDDLYPVDEVITAAEAATSLDDGHTSICRANLVDSDSAVRYWGALGLLARGKDAVEKHRDALTKALGDKSPYVAIAAAEALARYGTEADLKPALDVLGRYAPAETNDAFISMAAMNAIDILDEKARPLADRIKQGGMVDKKAPKRSQGYSKRLQATILGKLQ